MVAVAAAVAARRSVIDSVFVALRDTRRSRRTVFLMGVLSCWAIAGYFVIEVCDQIPWFSFNLFLIEMNASNVFHHGKD